MLYTHAMPSTGHPGHELRRGASPSAARGRRARRRRARSAVLVRSLTAVSLGVPHTGAGQYPDGGSARIPAAAISVEDATLLARLARARRR